MDKPHLDPNTNLLTEEYAEGVGEFMRLVHQQPEANTGMLKCPCSSCNNNRILKEWDVRTHLYMRGFTQNYKVWCLHGENGYEYGSTSEPQHVESIFVCSIRMSLVPCRLSSLFSNPAESISVCSIRIHKDTQLGKSKNGISRCINQMRYSMLRKGYPTYSVIPNDERHLWFRNFAKELCLNGKTPKYINPTVWLELQEHWVDQETIDKSIKNSANRNNDRGGKGIYVHNLGACSMSSKKDELRRTLTRRRGKFRISSSKIINFVQTQKEALLASQPISDDDSSAASTNITRVQIHQIVEQPISDDDSSAASTNITRVQIHQIVEQAIPKKKGRLVGLARRASSCPSSSQVPFAPPDPTIIEHLQNKDDRMVALETQNATILAELAGQKKTNEEIMEKMKRLFPNDF
ncbi:hypothetical protein DY000_02031907 [Brassica cretica]|uniref:Transposase-associated domain-containing protein n=1 Tax=Brassica cretica TaxID=69181 RepID=A0ABQ7DUW7_BRACR|nr:hypothetical protein DY000_02031907 [Brassica cretica]